MKTFAEWLQGREGLDEYGVDGGLPYGAQSTPPTSMQTQPQVTPTSSPNKLIGVPPIVVKQLQMTGPAMGDIMNAANKSIQLGKHRDLTSALQSALQQYKPTDAMNKQTQAVGQTAPNAAQTGIQ